MAQVKYDRLNLVQVRAFGLFHPIKHLVKQSFGLRQNLGFELSAREFLYFGFFILLTSRKRITHYPKSHSQSDLHLCISRLQNNSGAPFSPGAPL